MGTQASPIIPKRNEGAAVRGTALASKLQNDGAKSLRFPDDIAELDHWCAIRVFAHKLMRRQDSAINDDYCRIFLPMPANLTTGYSHGYNAESLGPEGAVAAQAGAAAAGQFRSGNFSVSSLVDQITSGTDIEGVIAGAATKVTNVAENTPGLQNITKGALGGAGIARNPFQALIYDAPAMREHSFSWKLVARNYKESQSIYDIVRVLKYHAAPGRGTPGQVAGQSVFLSYPDQFDVDFHYDDFLYNMAPSVLKSISVNYHPDGPMYHTSQDGKKAPVSVQLELSFQETSIITRGDIQASDR